MSITFVMGIAGAGKSTYIKGKFPDCTVIDLYDFQKNGYVLNSGMSFEEQCLQSYYACRDAVVEAIKNGEDVVMEHTLLRAIRREMYVEAVKNVTDEPIDIIVINPPVDTIKERWSLRKLNPTDEEIKYNLSVLEIPTKEEGFRNITVVTE